MVGSDGEGKVAGTGEAGDVGTGEAGGHGRRRSTGSAARRQFVPSDDEDSSGEKHLVFCCVVNPECFIPGAGLWMTFESSEVQGPGADSGFDQNETAMAPGKKIVAPGGSGF